MKYNLSEITEVIKNRRTIYPQHYSSRVVHKEIIEHLLQNATWAPTHGMTQPWRFKIYTGESRNALAVSLSSLYKKLTPEDQFREDKLLKIQARPFQSSAAIVVYMKRGDNPKIPEIEEISSVACAVQNICLTATAYGIGSFWSTPKVIYTPEMNEILKIRDQDKCMGIIYLGYPNEDWPKGQRKPIEYVTEWYD